MSPEGIGVGIVGVGAHLPENVRPNSFWPEEWREALVRMGERPYRALPIFQWIHRRGVTDPRQMTDLPASLRDRLVADGLGPALEVTTVQRRDDERPPDPADDRDDETPR